MEAAFLLARDGFDADELFALADAGAIAVGLEFNRERGALRSLLRKYHSVSEASTVGNHGQSQRKRSGDMPRRSAAEPR